MNGNLETVADLTFEQMVQINHVVLRPGKSCIRLGSEQTLVNKAQNLITPFWTPVRWNVMKGVDVLGFSEFMHRGIGYRGKKVQMGNIARGQRGSNEILMDAVSAPPGIRLRSPVRQTH